MKLYIFTEGSIDIGFGHITRCIALYRQFEQRGWAPKLIIRGDKTIQSLVAKIDCIFADWLDPHVLRQYLPNKIDIAIVDSYLADTKIFSKISRSVNLIVCIDDNNRLDYPKGIVVNGNIHANLLAYKNNTGQSYLLGPTFTMLREEFSDVPKKMIRKKIQHILITFGGDDIRKMTPKILTALDAAYPEMKKITIIGAGFKHTKQLLNQQNNNTSFVINPSSSCIKELMINTDIAISGGGQTLYELACTGTPTIGIGIADNQICNIHELAKQGIIINVGMWDVENITENVIHGISSINSMEKRSMLSHLGQKYVDGKGAYRVTAEILSYYVKNNLIIRKAVPSDGKQILNLSDNPTIRKLSFQTKPITESEHSKWFKEKISDKNCLYFVAVLPDVIAGQMRLDIKDTEATISISINPQYQGYGIGTTLFKKGTETLRNKHPSVKEITALIKKENRVSQLFFEKIGFIQKRNAGKPDVLKYNYMVDNQNT